MKRYIEENKYQTASSLQWNEKERIFGWVFKTTAIFNITYNDLDYLDWIASSN